MRRMTAVVLGVFALTALLNGAAVGQEKKAKKAQKIKPAKARPDDATKIKKIELLTQEVIKAQKELAKELNDSLTLKHSDPGNPRKSTIARIAKLESALKEAIDKDGAKSKAANKIRRKLAALREEVRVLGGGGLNPVEFDAVDTAKQYNKKGRGKTKLEPDELTQEELALRGQQLVTQGQEFKMLALAKKVNDTQDETLRSELTRELHAAAKDLQDSRKKTQDQEIKKLEEQLKMLRAASKSVESPEDVVKKLLDSNKKKSKKNKKEEKGSEDAPKAAGKDKK